MDYFSAVLAVEFAAPRAPGAWNLIATHEAAPLFDAVAADLARLVPAVTACDLVGGGVLLDAAQILRPGFPLDQALAGLKRALGARGRGGISAFGAAGGVMPDPALVPEAALGGGAMWYLPWQVHGDAAALAPVQAEFERRFEDEGLAGAAVNLYLRQALSEEVVHARYLTRLDLLALLALQLDHAGLGPAWSLLEGALLAPHQALAIELPHGGSLALADGRAFGRCARLSSLLDAYTDRADAANAFARQLWFVRSAGALLGAHRLPINWALAAPNPGAQLDESAVIALDGTGPWTRLTHPLLGVAGLGARGADGALLCVWPLTLAAFQAIRQLPAPTQDLSQWLERLGD